MIGRVLLLGVRLFYAAIGVVGLSLARSGYPPSGSDPPVMLLVGAALVVVGVVGVVWPEKVLSGSSTGTAG